MKLSLLLLREQANGHTKSMNDMPSCRPLSSDRCRGFGPATALEEHMGMSTASVYVRSIVLSSLSVARLVVVMRHETRTAALHLGAHPAGRLVRQED